MIDVCRNWKRMLHEDSSFLNHVITVDESWDFHHNPNTKCESIEWQTSSSPLMKKIPQTKLAIKVLLYVFFDKGGVIHRSVIPPCMMITTDAYINNLESLCRHLWSKCSGLARSFILHHVNARSHTVKVMFEYHAAKMIKVLPYPSNRLDLTPCNFWLFLKLKELLKNWMFSTNKDILLACNQIFDHTPAIEFAKTFQK